MSEEISAGWRYALVEDAAVSRLASELGVTTTFAMFLVNRGQHEAAGARRYLAPRLADLRAPDGDSAMHGFRVAVDRLVAAITNGEVVGLFGDYDVDGVTSAALLARTIKRAGGRVAVRVAERDRGYGLSPEVVAELAAEGARVLVTCDCGTSDTAAIEAASARNIAVIVVDHHQVPDLSAGEPPWLALINPHQPRCRFPFKGLASVGVAFYLAASLRTALKAVGRTAPDPREELDLVAIGTICDLAPLSDENRILVHAGLQRLREKPRPGLRALARAAAFELSTVKAGDVGMRIGPRLNAPGRLGSAQLALSLLLAETDDEANRLADEIEGVNQRRRELTQVVTDAARVQGRAELDAGRRAIVVAGDGWSHGVVGIVAARLVEELGRPAVVIAFDGTGPDAVGRGSLRTIPGINLYAALCEAAPHTERYGGHAAAAGVTLRRGKLDAFRDAFDAAIGRAAAARAELALDAALPLSAIDLPLVEDLARLEPCGVGNPEPCLGSGPVFLERTRVVGGDHLQVTFRDGAVVRDGIAFRMGARDPGAGTRVEAAYVPEIDTWRGTKRLRLRVRDFRLA
jgi:single-stranded-DNA-specific exonuclease